MLPDYGSALWQSLAEWVIAIATVVLVVYSYLMIKEGKKNRRKDTIEKELEQVYSPIYEIMRRARHETSQDRQDIRARECRKGPRDWAFEEREYEEIRKIFATFGHYLDSDGFAKLMIEFDASDRESSDEQSIIVWLPRASGTTEKVERKYYRFVNPLLDPHFERIKDRRQQLMKELKIL